MDDIKILKETPVEQLQVMADDCYKQLFALRNNNKSGKMIAKSSQVRLFKKQIARIKTVLRQKGCK